MSVCKIYSVMYAINIKKKRAVKPIPTEKCVGKEIQAV
jgi:hypothetical protein